MESVPLHKLLGVEPESTTSFHSNIPTVTNSSTAVRHTNDDQQPITPPSSPSSLSSSPTSSNQDTLVTIIPLAVINRILATITVQHEPITDGATDRDGIREPVTDEMIYLLLLELLENVWFRLSPDYSGSAPLWKKLTNYFTLLQDVGRSTLHQVLYHLQCLFSHDSTMLKSQLTVHVVLPLHVYIITQVREKVYDNQISHCTRYCIIFSVYSVTILPC